MHPARILTATLLLSATVFGQTTTTTPPKKPATTAAHHTTTTTHRAVPAAKAPSMDTLLGIPPLPASIPAVTGEAKPLYALSYIDITTGSGAEPEPGKFLTVHYTGWLTDGTKFDSSVDRGEPFTFQYAARQVISGWDNGFGGMKVGGKRRLFIPWQLAYGAFGRPPVIPAKAMLIFDMELLGVANEPPAPKSAPGAGRR